MPARRRVSASRGVRSRGTASRARSGPIAGRLGLIAILVVIGGAVAWLVGAQALSAAGLGRLRAADPSAPARQTTPVAVVAAAPAAPTPSGPRPAADAPVLTRPWDATAPGIDIDPALVTRLDEALVGVDGHVGVAVEDLGSGRGAVLNGTDELAAASLYKLPVLYTVFDTGLSMAEELPITDEARSYDAGTMELGVGETLSVAELLERMVTLSDNTSAVMLGSRVGATRVNASIRGLGLETTHYSLERMTTSALDMLHVLDLLAHGKLVSPSASADMLHLLLRQRVNDRLPRLLPESVQVAHKTGNLPGTVNDVGVLYGPSSTVIVAALVSETTDETAAATGIARLALAAESYFEAQPAQGERLLIPAAPTRPVPPVWREPRPVPTPVPLAPTAVTSPLETRPTPLVQPSLEPTALEVPALAPARVPTTTRPPASAPTPPASAATVATVAAVATTAPTSPPPTSTPLPKPTPPPPPPAPPAVVLTVVAAPTRPPTPRPAPPAATPAPTAAPTVVHR